ncbi:hypothetical protein [Streptomyces sp. NPDC058240]|uniref:hypothetical protein n=1 Tax=Streptomyces sp. NPDC058240 TaxID=3346396 RepID=UPI0036E7DA76
MITPSQLPVGLRRDRLAQQLAAMRVVRTDVVEGYREAGVMRADAPADHVTRTMMAAAQGFFAQMAPSATPSRRCWRAACAA